MTLALIGGEEFADGFEPIHARLSRLLLERQDAGRPLQLAFLPTCAADDGPQAVAHWCRTAETRLTSPQVTVRALPISSRQNAGETDLVDWLRRADWIYFGGGYPQVALRILTGTPALEAIRTAWARGALVSGASGGAMLLCGRAWVVTPEIEASVGALAGDAGAAALPTPEFVDGLGLLPSSLCWPHMDRGFSLPWLRQGAQPPGLTLVGIDEQTLITDLGGEWQVLGRGRVRIVDPDSRVHDFTHGERVPARLLPGGPS